MAYATQSDRALGGATLGQRLGGARATLAERFARYRTYRRTLSELAQLSDRDLADLGVHRADIAGIARDAAYRA
jgi:uncharacterized protein YjiS (DUF1127 family)